jgi:peptide/nickel transport system substrate-binding protein
MALALVLSACQPAAEDGDGTEKEPPPPDDMVTPEYGGTLIVQRWTIDAASWDPADCLWSMGGFGRHFEHLLRGDRYKGPRGTNEFGFTPWEAIPNSMLTGAIAESYEITTDPLQIIFHIRPGIMWNVRNSAVMEPREVTAHDAEFALKRYRDTPKSSPARLEWVDSIEAIDDSTLVLSLNTFHGNWSYLTAWGWSTMIYPPELVDADITDWKNAVGTGPWMIEDYISGSSLTYVKNPTYWDKEIIDGVSYDIPFADKLLTPIVVDESTRVAALRTGKVDIDYSVTWRFRDSLQETNPDLIFHTVTGTGVLMTAMRVDQEPFDDIRVRRAMNLAVDNQAVLDSQYGGTGNVLNFPLYADFPENIRTPLEKLPAETRELFEYHPDKAKELLAEAGYPNGFKTKVAVRNYPTDMDIVTMYAAYWADIGVEVELDPMEYAALQGVMKSKEFEGMLAVGKGTAATPFATLRAVGLTGQWWNPAAFSDTWFDDTYDVAKTTIDQADQDKIIKELAEYFLAEAPYVPGPGGTEYRVAQPWVHNFWGEATYDYIDISGPMATVLLDLAMKAERTGE